MTLYLPHESEEVPYQGAYKPEISNIDIFEAVASRATEDEGSISIVGEELLEEIAEQLKIPIQTREMVMKRPNIELVLPNGQSIDLNDKEKKTMIYNLYVKSLKNGEITDDEETIIYSLGLLLGMDHELIQNQKIEAKKIY